PSGRGRGVSRSLSLAGLLAVAVWASGPSRCWAPLPLTGSDHSRRERCARGGRRDADAAEEQVSETRPLLRRGALLATLGGALGALGAAAVGVKAGRAISGGGQDFASVDLTGKSFKQGKFDAKDFSGSMAKNLDFTKSSFRGCRFYKADLTGSDFSNSDLSGATLEAANLSSVNFEGANLEGSYFSDTILDAKNFKGAVFTDALIPQKIAEMMCQREDVQADPKTRDSIPCP
ncbi:unnamed protein product, partial [Polarella glacialis]